MDAETRKRIIDGLCDQKTIQQLSDAGTSAQRRRMELEGVRDVLNRGREDGEGGEQEAEEQGDGGHTAAANAACENPGDPK